MISLRKHIWCIVSSIKFITSSEIPSPESFVFIIIVFGKVETIVIISLSSEIRDRIKVPTS